MRILCEHCGNILTEDLESTSEVMRGYVGCSEDVQPMLWLAPKVE